MSAAEPAASAPASTSTSTTPVASGGAGGGAGASAGATAEAGATAAATAMNRVLPHLRLAAASAASGGSAAASTTTASALEAAQQYMKSVKTLLVDCDGVLWRGSDPIPGSAEAVEALRSAGKRVMFVTNNSTKSRAMYVKKLASGGITATADDIMSTSYGTAAYLKSIAKIPAGSKIYMIGQSGLAEELKTAGFEPLGLEDSGAAFQFGSFDKAALDSDVKAVVCGFDVDFNYRKLAKAASYVRYNDALFVMTNRDATYPDKYLMLPGGGSIAKCVEVAAGRPFDVEIGKPTATMLDALVAERGVDLSTAAMVGDRLNTDMGFGNQRGLTTVLVLTGVSNMEQALEAEAWCRPDIVADSLAALLPAAGLE